MKNLVHFGLGADYDRGSDPSIALNRGGTVLEVHKNAVGHSLFYRVARLSQATITGGLMGRSTHYDSGVTPRIALNTHGDAFEVHKSQGGPGLWCHFWRVEGGEVRRIWKGKYDSGVNPAVALSDSGTVVEVHKSQGNRGLWYNLGRIDRDAFRWVGKGRYGTGMDPSVDINNQGTIIEVHEAARSSLVYRIGRVVGTKIVFGPSTRFGEGRNPSVALTAAGNVVFTFRHRSANELFVRTGQVRDDHIDWTDKPAYFDAGTTTSVAAAGTMSVEVHEGRLLKSLWFSTSIITDRASWMQTRLRTLGSKRLGDLVLPASHDAGMYKAGFSQPGRTQNLSILEQLRNGIRYFDLRPMYIDLPVSNHFVIAHGVIVGPSLDTVLKDIRTFALEGHRELVILKFSHFANFDNEVYKKMAALIGSRLETWLVTTTPGKKRLADVTLREYVRKKKGPAILIVVDLDFAIDNPAPGFWVYRDWHSSKKAAAQGDLNVFDRWSNTINVNTMRGNQFQKFRDFDGKMKNDTSLPCDLFLLSWTLTPPTIVWEFAKPVNRRLGQDIRHGQAEPIVIPNDEGKIMNLLYVDYVETARVTDVALFMNGEPVPVHVATRPVVTRPVRPMR